MTLTWSRDWPVLTTYDGEHLPRLALPLGGIGTGTVSLGGRGDLRDWEIMNRPAKGYVPHACHDERQQPSAVLYLKPAGRPPLARLLEGPLDLAQYEGASGSTAPNHGLPRFRQATFAAAYPCAQLHLSDRDVPCTVRLEAFNPLIPGDADRSAMPVAILRYVVTNRTRERLPATLCLSLPNFIGMDGSRLEPGRGGSRVLGAKQNRNHIRTGPNCHGLFLRSEGVDALDPAWGTIALATTAAPKETSCRTAWAKLSWGDSLLDFWDDLLADGKLDEREVEAVDSPTASLAVRLSLPPRGSRQVTFLLAWHFPNRVTWTAPPTGSAGCGCGPGATCATTPDGQVIIGNHYTGRFADAWAAAEETAASLPELERETLAFLHAFTGSSVPHAVQEAALANLSTLRSQTVFRTPDGRLFGYEGCNDGSGCCHGSCTHVWNYEQATPFLFGELAKTMREVEFAYATDDQGLMAFRVNLPLSRAQEFGKAAADGQLGCLVKLYREWQLSGDEEMLLRLWPAARRALEFCWLPGSWDADQDGVMEGCQHNTMDVEYYGPNPQMQAWYLAALRAAEEMARHLGAEEFAGLCRQRFDQGRQWTDKQLFNGDYYEHQIRPPKSAAEVHPALRIGMGAADLSQPALQLGAGCLVDQLVGQYAAHVAGLGYLLDKGHVRTTLRSILTHNRRTSFHDHFNHLRSFALGDESALLMATYPKGRRPTRPFPYYNEVMTGFEYTVAAHLFYEGQPAAALQVVSDIRARYDGRRRNPFDEAECGHHYARAMASWACVLGVTGFRYSAVTQCLTFTARPGTWFWSTGYAWGTCQVRRAKKGLRVELTVLFGDLTLRRFVLAGRGDAKFSPGYRLRAGQTLPIKVA